MVDERDAEQRVLVGVGALGEVTERGRDFSRLDTQIDTFAGEQLIAQVGAQKASQRSPPGGVDGELVEQGQALVDDDIGKQVETQMTEGAVRPAQEVGVTSIFAGIRQKNIERTGHEDGGICLSARPTSC